MAPFTLHRDMDQLRLRRRLAPGLIRAALALGLAAVVPAAFISLAPNLWPFNPARPVFWGIWVFLAFPFVVMLAGPLFDLTPFGRLGEEFVFDRRQARLTRNRRRVSRLADLVAVRVESTGGRNPKTRVLLLRRGGPPVTLTNDGALLVWLADGQALARVVANFVGVPVIDNAL